MSEIAAVGLWVATTLCAVVLLWRNNLVHAARIARISAIGKEARRRIEVGEGGIDALWDEFENGPSYDAMLLDLRTWRAASFYPLPVGASLSGVAA